MSSSVLKKAICFSLLGHITVFSIFNLSFGNKIPRLNYAAVSFWGPVLLNSELTINKPIFRGKSAKEEYKRRADIVLLANSKIDFPQLTRHYFKPSLAFPSIRDKVPYVGQSLPQAVPLGIRRDLSITLYPNLPYNFLLYFKDRQVVHIELMFNIVSDSNKNTIAIKRKISSGNLEADLLSMRYMNHYLFVQQSRFIPNKWQTVKIELSPKND